MNELLVKFLPACQKTVKSACNFSPLPIFIEIKKNRLKKMAISNLYQGNLSFSESINIRDK